MVLSVSRRSAGRQGFGKAGVRRSPQPLLRAAKKVPLWRRGDPIGLGMRAKNNNPPSPPAASAWPQLLAELGEDDVLLVVTSSSKESPLRLERRPIGERVTINKSAVAHGLAAATAAWPTRSFVRAAKTRVRSLSRLAACRR